MASYYEMMQRLEDERIRRARELSHAEMAQTPGMPAYAERARADMPGGVELASMSGLPLISDAADAALTADALEQGNWKDAAIGATALAVPFVGAPLIRKGVDWLGEKGAKGGPTIPVGGGIEAEMAALGAALGPKSELSMAAPKAYKPGVRKTIPVTTPALQAEGVPDDMIASLTSQKKLQKGPNKGKWNPKIVDKQVKGEPVMLRDNLNARLAQREQYMLEPGVTPGPNASAEEWTAWGDKYGANIRLTDPVSVGHQNGGKDIKIPGGYEGTFTIPDLFWMKANNFKPGDLPKAEHEKLMQKYVRTHHRENPDEVDVFNSLAFSQLSPSAPLTPNEFLAARFRVRNKEELQALADRAGEPNLNANMVRESGVGGAAQGGFGARGTANLANLPELAKQILANPQTFKKQPGETVRDVGFRMMNQVPGLSTKTANLGVPFLDLKNANTSAIDIHMTDWGLPRLVNDPEVGGDVRRMIQKKAGTDDVDSLLASDPKAAREAVQGAIWGNPTYTYRDPQGGVNPQAQADPRLHPSLLAVEPKNNKITGFSPLYNKLLDYVDESRDGDLAVFPEQWRLWDVQRQRNEPHELFHPDYRLLPKGGFDEFQQSFQRHGDIGFKTKGPIKDNNLTWQQLYYGRADPRLLGGIALGGAGAAALPLFNDDEP